MELIINDLHESNIRIKIADYIDDLLLGISEDEFKYIDMQLVGSRINGNSREDSDLDVIVYYKGTMKDDSAFNLFNDESYRLNIEGIVVDINTKNINNNMSI